MKRKAIESKSIEELVKIFADSAEEFYRARNEAVLPHKIVRSYYNAQQCAFEELERRGTKVSLLSLLNDSRPEVRLEAAYRVHDLDPIKTENVIKELAEVNGLVGFTAKNALDSIRGVSRFEGPPPLTP